MPKILFFTFIRVAKKTWSLTIYAKKPGNTWNLRNFENNLDFCTKVIEKPGISYKNHGKT